MRLFLRHRTHCSGIASDLLAEYLARLLSRKVYETKPGCWQGGVGASDKGRRRGQVPFGPSLRRPLRYGRKDRFDGPAPAIGTAVTLPAFFDLSGDGMTLNKNLGDQDERR